MSDIITNENNNLFTLIKERINASKRNLFSVVNVEMVVLYWSIGRLIKSEVLKNDKAGYGKAVISDLSMELKREFGIGYSQRNLFNMLKFFEIFPDEQILQTLSAKLSWSHFIKLITIEDNLKREFYTTMCISERWSVRALNERINSMLYERTAISRKPEITIENDLKQLTS